MIVPSFLIVPARSGTTESMIVLSRSVVPPPEGEGTREKIDS